MEITSLSHGVQRSLGMFASDYSVFFAQPRNPRDADALPNWRKHSDGLLLDARLSASFLAAMPTYEYTCLKCGHQFDFFQSIAEKPISSCPKKLCPEKFWGKGRVKRGIGGGAGLIFKGSGFYITDYRSDKYKEAAKKDAAPSTASNGKSGGESKPVSPKTESKPAKPASGSGST